MRNDCRSRRAVLGADSDNNYFIADSLQFLVDLLLICIGCEISHIPIAKYNAPGDEYQ
jgi:hypothetical protein